MMLLKTALKNLKKNPVMNIVCLLQLTAIFLITAVMVSSICVRYKRYLPVKDILKLNGIFCEYSYNAGAVFPETATGDMRGSVDSYEELREYTGAKNVFGVKSLYVIRSSPDGGIYEDDTTMSFGVIYGDELINRYIPKLARGRWIDPGSDELEAVIPEGLYGADVGTVIDMLFTQAHDPVRVNVRVVGVLKDGEDFLCPNSPYGRQSTGTSRTYRNLYCSYLAERDEGENPPILLSERALKRLYPQTKTMIVGAFFDFSEADASFQDMVSRTARTGGAAISLKNMDFESRDYIRTELMKLLPVVIVLMVLVLVSAVSVSAIAARRRLRDYAKYYVLGLRWRQCALVNLFQTLVTGAAAFVAAAIGITAVNATRLSDTFAVTPNFWVFAAIFGIFALYLIFSMIMPLIMLNSATPKELLQTE